MTHILSPSANVDTNLLVVFQFVSTSCELNRRRLILVLSLHEFEVVDTNQELTRDLAVRKREEAAILIDDDEESLPQVHGRLSSLLSCSVEHVLDITCADFVDGHGETFGCLLEI